MKNVSAWEALIADLSDTQRDYEEDEDTRLSFSLDNNDEAGGGYCGLNINDHTSSSSAPLMPPRCLPQSFQNIHNDDKKTASASAAASSKDTTEIKSSSHTTPPPPRKLLESPCNLKDWIAFHSSQHHPPPPSSSSLHHNMGRRKMMNETYVLNATQIALSLARKLLARQFDEVSIIHCEDVIIIDNVIVTNVESLEVEFECSSGANCNRNTSDDDGSEKNNNTERRQVLALGMILYELFTQGIPPPIWIQQSLKSSSSSSSGRRRSLLSFGASLRISSESEDDTNDRGEDAATTTTTGGN
jgi:hypothetical protein